MRRKPLILASGEMELSTFELELVIYAIDEMPLTSRTIERLDQVAALRERFAVELDFRLTRVRRKGGQ